MLIDLTDIIKNVNGKLDISEKFKMPSVSFLGEEFSFIEDCLVKGEIINNSKALELSLTVAGKANVHCARCQKPLTVDVSFPVTETLVREGTEISDAEDVVLYSGKAVELDDIIVSAFLMNASAKYLCKEDCKGLCPNCGVDLNDGDCDCGKEISGAWQDKLAEIMKNMTDTE